MKRVRKYGEPPFKVAVVHGGPGAAGQLAPVAKELSRTFGVFEPLQTAASIEGQIQELHDVLESNAHHPVTLIGHSWGAMLSVLFAAKFPALVKKLILVSCGPLEASYTSSDVMKNRLGRMSIEQKAELDAAFKKLDDPKVQDKNAVFTQLGRLASKTDSYEPISDESVEAQYDIFKSVWSEAESLRSKGVFIEAVKNIRCPVFAIHGDYDPHPFDGVKRPLSTFLKDFRIILLEKCGHYPWIERHARNKFYSILLGAMPCEYLNTNNYKDFMKCIVTKNYQSAYSDPIRLRPGSVVTWTNRESDWKGWVWCKDAVGKEGWVPESFLVKNGNKASITLDYVAKELTVTIGEELEILSEEAGWLWCRNNMGDCGWVPKENVEIK